MDEEVKLKITRGELGLLYLAVCELLDKKAGMVLDRNDIRHNQLMKLRSKIQQQG